MIKKYFISSINFRFIIKDETNRGVLPRQVLFFIDEFGNLPPIRDVDTLFSAIRSRGVRIIISLQSYAQLHKNYSEKQAKIIEDTCQMLMNGFCAPSATETAKRISEALDKETVLSGSVQTGRGVQTTQSMVGKSLMSIGELITLPLGEFIVQKGGTKPLRSHLSGYYEYLKLPDRKPTATEINGYIDVHVMKTDDLTARLGFAPDVEKEMEEFL